METSWSIFQRTKTIKTKWDCQSFRTMSFSDSFLICFCVNITFNVSCSVLFFFLLYLVGLALNLRRLVLFNLFVLYIFHALFLAHGRARGRFEERMKLGQRCTRAKNIRLSSFSSN